MNFQPGPAAPDDDNLASLLAIPPKFMELFAPTRQSRYKVFYGGRGSGKSWQIARAIILLCHTRMVPVVETGEFRGLKVLCVREYQTSIADSVHSVLKVQIRLLGLTEYFDVGKTTIRSKVTGAEIIFDGLHFNVDQIKSKEGIDLCWVEEAHSVTDDSWRILLPTIRDDPPGGPFGTGAEIWISFNQREEEDPTFKRWVLKPPASALVVPVTWEDNPFFPSVLDEERRAMLESDDQGAYDWVWGLSTRTMGSSIIFRGKCTFEAFESPDRPERFFYGADWGFSTDPSVLTRSFVTEGDGWRDLWVDYEAFGWGVEIDDLPALFGGGLDSKGNDWPGVPGARQWPIKADSARPETISYMVRRGFNIAPAEKWEGCVEDGVEYLRGFRRIHIHERCKHLAQEARLYSYKVDKQSQDVLPIIVDRHNHGWDSLRYGHDGYIQGRGVLSEWEKAFGTG